MGGRIEVGGRGARSLHQEAHDSETSSGEKPHTL